MYKSAETTRFQEIVQKVYPQTRLLKACRLEGGVSAEVTALQIEEADGQIRKLVLRRCTTGAFGLHAVSLSHEYRLLHLLEAQGLAIPKPYLFDTSGDILEEAYLLMAFVEGQTDFHPDNLYDHMRQVARQLARIHEIRADAGLDFLPRLDRGFGERPTQLDESLSEGLIRETLERMQPFSDFQMPVLLHGDYWEGNLLWQAGQLKAVIDWEDACLGSPLFDVANYRLETLWAMGVDAMNIFTESYQSITAIDLTQLPYWDLCAALKPASKLSTWGLDASTEARMRQAHRFFVEQALDKLNPDHLIGKPTTHDNT